MSIFDFFKKFRRKSNNETNNNTEPQIVVDKEKLYNLLAKAITKEITKDEFLELFDMLIGPSLKMDNIVVPKIVYQKLENKTSEIYTSMEYNTLFNVIFVDPAYIDKYLNGEIELSTVFVSIFHEKRHAVQTARNNNARMEIGANPNENVADHIKDDVYGIYNEEKVDEILNNFLNDKDFKEVAVEWAKTRIRVKEEEQEDKEVVLNFATVFREFFPEKENFEQFLNDIGFGFYLDSAVEIDARKWSVYETISLVEAIAIETKDIPLFQNWCKNQIKPLEDEVKQEDVYINKYIEQARNFFDVDVSETQLIKLITGIQKNVSKMKIDKDNYEKIFKFQNMSEAILRKLFEQKDFETLINYFFAIKISGIFIPSVSNNTVSLEQDSSFFGENILFELIEQKLPEQSPEVQKNFKDKLHALMYTEPSPLPYFHILDDEAKKEFITNSNCISSTFMLIHGHYDLDSDVTNAFSLFDENNEQDREKVKQILKRFDENYNIYLGPEYSFDERAIRQWQTSDFMMDYYLGNKEVFAELMERFGYSKEFNEILARSEDNRIVIDDETIKRLGLNRNKNLSSTLSHSEYLRIFFGEVKEEPTNLLPDGDEGISV